ncbi:MAG: glutamine--fructose-6-phosphate transaminase (isomerizing) [Candidatus Woesearchaeota archaeon]|jgi:glucosamine--fructose-6-phosphate aminotransferase (isomerizing)|nr:glutamine--fructose-6-phosphate transaminase (isomerizing) [Candidatus Woesearchaeota archaeon]MDP6265818.1 glutamine--fructose-6-phosphate transaminase (isomerizing) [Candidatus Woesearchaeota archaeon]MDP7476634.1 glutamine--fructose-6-phosphate transaminase (isomerizing) [Candidatus Woesearchaeota archaeon]HJO02105.1 glutamine--fructose-6-phosphate transaminase (isomerizing) [Candidatus Woesearchaeota archaeon]|tara:strand:+ start:96 stop:1925 length:1830 start_codon:yes stop_codon:yes gene_type:complete
MCGIIGYIGNNKAVPILMEALKRLEYRGYDSAGFCTINEDNILIEKDIGKIQEVENKVNLNGLNGQVGLSHCRWATTGSVTKENAHPHTDCKNMISIVHNGIIENFSELKEKLIEKGHKFKSSTDTEVIAHLIEDNYNGDIEGATREALKQIDGSYALGVICAREPQKLIAARNESPLIVGLGKDENFIASDVPAILKYTNKVIYLENNEIAILEKNDYLIKNIDGNKIDKKINIIDWDSELAEKSGYEHFMLKEIHEQPRAITETLNGRIKDGKVELKEELNFNEDELKNIDRIIIVACGTSWHSALLGEFMLEELAKIPVEVEYASEFRYRNPIINENTLVIAISQSGETADTIAAIREAKKRDAKVISIVNAKGSSIARESDSVLYTYAGPEIGVASTKAFTSQLVVLYLFTLFMANLRKTLEEKIIFGLVEKLRKLPLQMQVLLDNNKEIKKIADIYKNKQNSLFLGRGVNFPIALEGALKLKEVSYIHAEGYPAAEMKHGPIALIDKNMPVVFIATKDVYTYKKVLGNIQEVKARNGIAIAIVTEGDKEIKKIADYVIEIPRTLYILSSILAAIPLQLLAYYVATERNLDPDTPRNLSKSVTVE